MEVTCLSSGVAHCSGFSKLSRPQRTRFTVDGRRSTAQAVRIMCPALYLPIGSQSLSPSCRSSLWGTTPVHCLSRFGSLPLLVFQAVLMEKAVKLGKRRNIARSYMESNNPILKFLSRVQGALPVVGLLSRLASGEGGIGADRVRFEEFCTRVGRNCSREDNKAFYALSARHGKSAKPQFLLLWCWAAAVGAGLLRSDDLLMGATRLRVSYDLQFEVENFDLLMDEATQRREKSGSKVPEVPMEFRVDKALEAMCKCCTGKSVILEEDAPLFATILKAVFPTVEKEQIDGFVASRLFDPLSTGAASVLEDSQVLNDGEMSLEKENEIAAVVSSQMLDPLNDEELDEDGEYSDDEEPSSLEEPPKSMAQELMQ